MASNNILNYLFPDINGSIIISEQHLALHNDITFIPNNRLYFIDKLLQIHLHIGRYTIIPHKYPFYRLTIINQKKIKIIEFKKSLKT